jgi:hypothetical protein
MATKIINKGCSGGAFYGLGMIGVFIYYFSSINSVGTFIMVVVKSIFWPAFLAYNLYGFLGMN